MDEWKKPLKIASESFTTYFNKNARTFSRFFVAERNSLLNWTTVEDSHSRLH